VIVAAREEPSSAWANHATRYGRASVHLGDPKERLLIVAIASSVATLDGALVDRAKNTQRNADGLLRHWLPAITGWIRPIDVCGFKVLETGCNAGRIERDYRDVSLDYADHYFVLFPRSGQSLVTQNEQATRLGAGDVVLVDTSRPVKLFARRRARRLCGPLLPQLLRRRLSLRKGLLLRRVECMAGGIVCRYWST
jgi:AraC-binding-like domain